MSTITQAKPSSLEHELSDDVYILTPEEEEMIEAAEREPCISAEEAKRRTRECLSNLAKNFS